MKRFLATTAIVTLMLTAFAGCSKDKDKENENLTPTVSTDQNGESEPSHIALGGYFTKENTSLVISYTTEGWKANGIRFSDEEGTEASVFSGSLTHSEGPNLVYEENGEKLTFTFSVDSMKVTADQGDTYAAFAGEYQRMDDNIVSETVSVVPASGSTLELLGRIAVAYYMMAEETTTDFTLELSSVAFDNNYMLSFLTSYAELFLIEKADAFPEISTEYLLCALTEEELNNILLTATAGDFDAADLSTEGSDIVLKDGVYYLPCHGEYAGGLASRYTDADPEELSDRLVLEAAIVKKDGTRSDITMTLSTSENTNAGTAGIQIDSVTYASAE